jgi:hypothetical protein
MENRAWQVMENKSEQGRVRQGKAWLSKTRRSVARQGKARQGKAWLGKGRRG